jgi:hypothetical protein
MWFRFIFVLFLVLGLHHAAMNRTMKKSTRIFRDGAHAPPLFARATGCDGLVG